MSRRFDIVEERENPDRVSWDESEYSKWFTENDYKKNIDYELKGEQLTWDWENARHVYKPRKWLFGFANDAIHSYFLIRF